MSTKWTAKTHEYFSRKSQGTPLNPLQPLQMERRGAGVLLNERLQRHPGGGRNAPSSSQPAVTAGGTPHPGIPSPNHPFHIIPTATPCCYHLHPHPNPVRSQPVPIDQPNIHVPRSSSAPRYPTQKCQLPSSTQQPFSWLLAPCPRPSSLPSHPVTFPQPRPHQSRLQTASPAVSKQRERRQLSEQQPDRA